MSKADDIQGYIAVMENIMNNLFTANVKIKEVRPYIEARIALKKQIPMKPEWNVRGPACSACYRDIPLEPKDHSTTTYCIYCGQAINWEGWKYGQC